VRGGGGVVYSGAANAGPQRALGPKLGPKLCEAADNRRSPLPFGILSQGLLHGSDVVLPSPTPSHPIPPPLQNLMKLLELDDVEILDLDFTCSVNVLGQTIEEELKPGGADCTVTNENLEEYLGLQCKYRVMNRIREQVRMCGQLSAACLGVSHCS